MDPDAKVTGFKPAYVATPAKDGHLQIRPTNLVTGVYWFDKAKGRPVFTWQVQQAFFESGSKESGWTYRPEILKAFGDKDGIVDLPQAIYDTPAKIELVRGLLKRYADIPEAELRIEVVPWAMSHSTVGKDQATRECTDCHAKRSILHRPLDLDDTLPKGVPVMYGGKIMHLVNHKGSGPTFDNRQLLSSFYIIGNSRAAWIEWLGWLSVVGALLFALVHGGIRFFGGRS